MDGILSEDLKAELYLFDTIVELRTRHIRWFEHVKHSDNLSSVMDMVLLGKRVRVGCSRPLKPV